MAAIATGHIGALSSDASDQNGTEETESQKKEAIGGFKNYSSVATVTRIVCNELIDLATSKFSLYLLATFAFNIPPVGYGLASLFPYTCNSQWLFVNTFLSAMHLGISIYTVQRVRQAAAKAIQDDEIETSYVKVDANGNTTESSNCSAANSCDRIRTFIYHDKIMAIYCALCSVWIIWQGIGTRNLVDGRVHHSCNRWVLFSVVCGFLYIGLALLAVLSSLCFLRCQNLQATTHQNETATDQSVKQVLTIDDEGAAPFA